MPSISTKGVKPSKKGGNPSTIITRRKKMPMEQFSVRMPSDEAKEVKSIARKHRCTIADVLRSACIFFFTNQKGA